MPTLKYLDPASGTYKVLPGIVGPRGERGDVGVVVEPPLSSRRMHAAATVISNATVTKVPWDTLDTSDDVPWNAGVSAFIAPSDGFYDVEGQVGFAANAAGSRVAYVYVSTTNRGAFSGESTGAGAAKFATTVKALAGDEISVRVQQTSGASLALAGSATYSTVSVTKVPAAYSGSAVSTYGEQNYALSARHAAVLSVPNSSNGTLVPFDTIDYADGLSLAAGTFTAPVAGYYQFSAKAGFDPNATGFRRIRLGLNGSSGIPGLEYSTPATGSIATSVSMVRTLKLAAGDTVTVLVDHNAGAALNLGSGSGYTSLDITKVPAPVVNGAAASGVWNVGPLAGFGTDPSIGREVYVDGLGQLRSNPDIVSGKLPTDLSPTWPVGTSVFYVPGADTTLWPGGSLVVTHKTYNNVIAQWCYYWSAVTPKAWYRNGSATAWSPWQQVVGESVPYATAAGSSAISGVTAGPMGVSLAITYPVGRFSTIPICVGSADSNGYGFGMAAGSSQTGVTLRYYNPAASVPTGTKVNWIATQMTAASGAGLLMARSAGNESTVTCHTDGCENAGAAIPMNLSEADRVSCGVCDQPITDVQR